MILASSQLIVHSSKVRTPQRHNSESVLYMNDEQKSICTSNSTEDLMSESSYQQRQFQQRSSDRSNRSDNRLFPINTYTEQPASLNTSTTSLDAKLVTLFFSFCIYLVIYLFIHYYFHNISHAILKSVVESFKTSMSHSLCLFYLFTCINKFLYIIFSFLDC